MFFYSLIINNIFLFDKLEIPEPSWEPVSNLENIHKEIQEFEEARKKNILAKELEINRNINNTNNNLG